MNLSGAIAAICLAPCNLARESMQAVLPKPAELRDPGVDLSKRLRVYRVDSPGSFDADSDEPALSQCPQMLRDARLRDAKLFLDRRRQTSGTLLATAEEFQNTTAYRIPQNVKCVHSYFSFGQCRMQWFGWPPRVLLFPEFLPRSRHGTIHRCCY